MKKKILLLILIVFVGIQFIRPDREQTSIDGESIFQIYQASDEVLQIVKTSCFDCHSNSTNYPFYAEIAPFSWWIEDHVKHGREELNFDNWAKISEDKEKALHKLEECVEELEEEKMPLNHYTWMHSDASLSSDQREVLIKFFDEVFNKVKNE